MFAKIATANKTNIKIFLQAKYKVPLYQADTPFPYLGMGGATGITYGTIAAEAGKLDEFKAAILEQKKLILDQRVADGNLTQEQADAIYNRLVTNQATCDGTGSAGIGKSMGAGFGQGMGLGKGQGIGKGNGGGMGRGVCLNN